MFWQLLMRLTVVVPLQYAAATFVFRTDAESGSSKMEVHSLNALRTRAVASFFLPLHFFLLSRFFLPFPSFAPPPPPSQRILKEFGKENGGIGEVR